MKEESKASGNLAVIYARYSSHNQRDKGLTIVDIYPDRALNGTNDNQPEFQRMLRDGRKRAYHSILTQRGIAEKSSLTSSWTSRAKLRQRTRS